MILLRDPKECQSFLLTQKMYGKKIGFVPTMGALHEGHVSLVRKAKEECDFVVVSLFVNPTQFNDPKDFASYPKTFEEDCNMLRALETDAVFSPVDPNQMYPDGYDLKVCFQSQEPKVMEDYYRPGHFDGMLSVVMKLFLIVRPHRAYFGEKDYQQLYLVDRMIRSYFLPIQLVPCPTLREKSGLAMSSRNRRLSSDGLKKSALIYEVLNKKDCTNEERKAVLTQNGFKVEYLEEHWGRRFVAAFLENVRLIDNVKID